MVFKYLKFNQCYLTWITNYKCIRMLVALLIVVPLTAAFLAWFYLFRNNTDIPVSPGAKPFVGHMHHFMDITMDNLYLYVFIKFF